MISINGLSKIYKDGSKALDNVSLSIERGEVCGIIGENGAGKTTLIRILTTKLQPTAGHVKIKGYDIVKDAGKIKEIVSIIPQESIPFGLLTVRDHIFYYARLRGFSKEESLKRTNYILDILNLWQNHNVITQKLSSGFKRKILLAMCMVSNAEILFLDEPTNGLDVKSQFIILQEIKKLSDFDKKTILITSHNLKELESVATRIAILHRGRLLEYGTPAELRNKILGNSQYRIVINKKNDKNSIDHNFKIIEIGEQSIVYVNTIEEVYDLMAEPNVERAEKISLEDVFLTLTSDSKQNHNIRGD